MGLLPERLQRWLPVNWPLRHKLLALVLLPILLVLPAILFLTIQWGSSFSIQQLLFKANTDLSVARDAFRRSQRDYLSALAQLADSYRFRERFNAGDMAGAERQVQALVRSHGFAFARLTDRQGRPLAGADAGAALPGTPLQARAAAGVPAVGVEIFGPQELARLDPALAARVRLPLVATPRSRPTDRQVEERGMLVRAVQPVTDADGRVLALLDGGVLLNGNMAFVDGIRRLVYGPGSLPEGSVGTVTVFLDDVRIATNVESAPGVRATGTRVSAAVLQQVLEQGRPWSARAFVVNDWYIAAYEPIVDVNGQRVGMLYAGFLERPLRGSYENALLILVALFGVVVALSAGLAVAGARSIFKPVETMTAVARATRAGQQARIGPTGARDELGELARQFDAMLVQLEERSRQVRDFADGLEHQVDLRTRELQSKNRDLLQTIRVLKETRRQLIAAEKFAALGKLSAGLAHEINNPIAILLGNLDLLVEDLGAAAEPVRDEITLIYDQVERINTLVRNLLHYSRPAERGGSAERVELAEVLRRSEGLARHLARRSRVELRLDLRAANRVEVNPSELQQVLMNLIINAIQAMPDGGAVDLVSEDGEEGWVVVSVRDDGPGIPQEHLDKVFDPFFTTKSREGGTGLGLAISYSLVRRAGGRIGVSSEPGRGTVFRIWLPPRPQPPQDGEGLLLPVV